MVLFHPFWLVLVIPLAVGLWIWPLSSRLLQVLRAAALCLILLALCGLAVRLPGRAGTVVVVADRSYSMPPDSDAAEKEAIGLIQGAMAGDERVGVVAFGERSVIERPPQRGKFAGFVTEVGRDGSNLGAAIEKAVALIPRDGSGRIVLLSDGRWTGRDPALSASRAAARDIPIDYRLLQRASANDVAVSRVDVPTAVTPGESFTISAWIRSPIPQEISFELKRGRRLLAAGTRTVPSGISLLLFRDTAETPGTCQYTLSVLGGQKDPVPENNTAKVLLGIKGPRPLLCVTGSQPRGLARLLEAGGMTIVAQSPGECHWTLEGISNFSAVLIENVPAEKVGVRGMETLAAWVKETGAGLMMTGGRNAYGPGGYFRSPLEPVMPISMELRREHRKLALAIVVAMDRSGSMAMPVRGSRTKMDLANLAAAQVLDLLNSMDEFGVVAVDSSAHIIAKLAPVENKAGLRHKILRVESMGGGIFIYEALSASARMLVSAQAGTRHIILFADAADSEEPGAYRKLIEKCRAANTTVSVIGLGTASDVDAGLLRDIASRGGGRCFFTTNPEELPRLFAQDTFVVARSAFLDEETPVRTTGGLVALTGRTFSPPLPVGGYNLCYLRRGANLAVVTTDEYKAPIVAAWQAGLGRVLCYTAEADGEYTGPIAGWQDMGRLLTSMARWVSGAFGTLPQDMLVTQELKGGTCVVQLHLDPEREGEALAELPRVTTLRGVPGTPPAVQKTTMQWMSADELAVEIPLRGSETVLSAVEVPGVGKVSLAPVCLPYSPEFKPIEAGAGVLTIERLARATGGSERVDLAGIWKELPRQPRMVGLGHWLLVAALVVLLLEVLERRTGFLTVRRRPARRKRDEEEKDVRRARRRPVRAPRARRRPTATRAPTPAPTQPAKERESPVPAGKEEGPGMVDALRRAQRRARKRTRR